MVYYGDDLAISTKHKDIVTDTFDIDLTTSSRPLKHGG